MAVSELRLAQTAEVSELVRQAMTSDRDAFGELYKLYVDKVYRYAYYMVANTNEAEDIASQTFLRAWQAIHRYRPTGAPFVSWLLRITHNLAIDHCRTPRREPLAEVVAADHVSYSPYLAAEQAERVARLRQAIVRLPPAQREVILLRFMEGLDHQEVAAATGRRVGAVRVLQHRGLMALRRLSTIGEEA